MANENLDLSWIASQESVDRIEQSIGEIRAELEHHSSSIAELKALVESSIQMIEEIGSQSDPSFGGYVVAPTEDELHKWNYTISDTERVVTLHNLTTGCADVVVYDKYQLTGGYYKTMLADGFVIANDGTVGSQVRTVKIHSKLTNEMTGIDGLFRYCVNLESIDFGTSFKGITSMNYTFAGCKNVPAITNLPDTSKVATMEYMLQGSGFGPGSLNLNTDSLISIKGMLSDTNNVGIDGFDTSHVQDFSYLYQGATAVTERQMARIIGGFDQQGAEVDTSSATNMSHMFSGLKVAKYNGENVQLNLGKLRVPTTCLNADGMFENIVNVKDICCYNGWAIPEGCSAAGMFTGSSVTNVTVIAGW